MLLEFALRWLRVGDRDRELYFAPLQANGILLITNLTSKTSIEANFFSDTFCPIFKGQFYFHSSPIGSFLNPPSYLIS